MDLRPTCHIGSKFDGQGRPLPYPGFSYISPLPYLSKSHRLFRWAARKLSRLPIGREFAILPSSSYHMTIMDLLCHKMRETSYWSSKIPIDLPWPEVEGIAQHLGRELNMSMDLEMVFSGICPFTGVFRYGAASLAIERRLKSYREQISDIFGVRHPNHDTYIHHVTLFYPLTHRQAESEAVYQEWKEEMEKLFFSQPSRMHLNAPYLAFFKEMSAYSPSGFFEKALK